jgi:diguanylate cyclase (GGDEF)-like protein/PAS domain S-box-containing protein
MDLLVLPVAVTMWLLQQAGFVADVPPWIFAILLLVAIFCTSIVYTLWPDEHCTYSQMSVRVGTEVSVISLIIYTCGWGPTLAIGYAFASANAIRASGSRAMKPAIFWCVSCIVMGQLMIVIGVAPTLISQPLVHGLAVLSGLGTVIVIWFQGWAAVQKETLEETVRNQEVRFEALVQHASDIITVFDLEGSVLYASPSFDRVLGYRPGPSVKLGRDLLHPDDIPHAAAFFKDVQANPSEVSWIEVRMRDRDGGWIWFEIGVTNLLDDPSVGGMIANMRDITERKLVEEQLSFQAYHDELTRLPNRSAFLERLKLSLDRARLHNRTVAVLFTDVDRFKLVNDSLGHEIGDHLLVEVADRLKECLRPGDLVARFGGDEFTVLLENIPTAADAVRVADRITEALRAPITVDGHELTVSTSTGIALSHTASDEHGDLLRDADLAMYLAKERGRNRWEIFDASSAPEIAERRAIGDELERRRRVG